MLLRSLCFRWPHLYATRRATLQTSQKHGATGLEQRQTDILAQWPVVAYRELTGESPSCWLGISKYWLGAFCARRRHSCKCRSCLDRGSGGLPCKRCWSRASVAMLPLILFIIQYSLGLPWESQACEIVNIRSASEMSPGARTGGQLTMTMTKAAAGTKSLAGAIISTNQPSCCK
jgi:hypothetical protein